MDLATRYEHAEVAEYLKEQGGKSAAEIVAGDSDDLDEEDDLLGVDFDDEDF